MIHSTRRANLKEKKATFNSLQAPRTTTRCNSLTVIYMDWILDAYSKLMTLEDCRMTNLAAHDSLWDTPHQSASSAVDIPLCRDCRTENETALPNQYLRKTKLQSRQSRCCCSTVRKHVQKTSFADEVTKKTSLANTAMK